jgi:hypothetical protein
MVLRQRGEREIMSGAKTTANKPWHRRGLVRLWLVCAIPVWAAAVLLPAVRWEGPPPRTLVFPECYVPTAPPPPARYCAARQDAAEEYARLRDAKLSRREQQTLAAALRAAPSDFEGLAEKLERIKQGRANRTEAELDQIQHDLGPVRYEISRRYQVAECHLQGTCAEDNTLASAQDSFWAAPCSQSEIDTAKRVQKEAEDRCEFVKSDEEHRAIAQSELNTARVYWATKLLLPSLGLLILPFFIAALIFAIINIYGWTRQGFRDD